VRLFWVSVEGMKNAAARRVKFPNYAKTPLHKLMPHANADVSVLQCVAVCCSVLQCVAVRGSVMWCVAVRGSVLQCVAVCCSVWWCVAVCCGVLQ